MKFVADSAKLLKAITPAVTVSSKGGLKEHEFFQQITLDVSSSKILAHAHGGRLATSISIDDLGGDLKFKCLEPGIATVNSVDLQKFLASFKPGAMVQVASDKEFIISNAADPDEYLTQPLIPAPVVPPAISSKYDKSVKIRSDVLVNSYKKIEFAVGFQERHEQYLYWQLTVGKDSIRAATSLGMMFAIIDVKGSGFVKSNEDIELVIPNDQTKIILSVLSETAEDVIIGRAAKTKDTPEQIVFESGDMKFVIVGHNPNVSWPQVDKFLTSDHVFKGTVKREDWEYATRGIMATFCDEMKKDHDTHESGLDISVSKGCIRLYTDHQLKASRKVPMEVKSKKDGFDEMTIYCCSPFLRDVAVKIPNSEEIEFSVENPSKPIVVRLPEKSYESGVTEQFSMFFGVLKK